MIKKAVNLYRSTRLKVIHLIQAFAVFFLVIGSDGRYHFLYSNFGAIHQKQPQ